MALGHSSTTRFVSALALLILITLICLDRVIGAELCLNHWTQPVAKPEVANPNTPSTTTAETKTEYELRPFWQRLSLAALQSVASIGVCYVLFQSRGRTLCRLYVLPSKSLAPDAPYLPKFSKRHDRALVLQNVWQWNDHGTVVPLAGNVNLESGSHDLELRLNLRPVGKYILPLGDAKVNGERYDSLDALKEAMYTAWYGPQKGVKEFAKLGWQSQ